MISRRPRGHFGFVWLWLRCLKRSASQADPGPQLQKLLDFRKSLEETRQVLYHGFANEAEFQAEVDRHLRAFAKGELPPANAPRDKVLLPLAVITKVQKEKAEKQQALAPAERGLNPRRHLAKTSEHRGDKKPRKNAGINVEALLLIRNALQISNAPHTAECKLCHPQSSADQQALNELAIIRVTLILASTRPLAWSSSRPSRIESLANVTRDCDSPLARSHA